MSGKSKADKGKKVVLTWQEKKAIVDKEEDAIEQEIQDQQKWIAMFESMNKEQTKNYLKNKRDHLKTTNIEKGETGKRKRRGGKSKNSPITSILGTVWKFPEHGK